MNIKSIFKAKNMLKVIWILGVVLLCTLPMGICPMWNGENPGHRNQYELMAESLLKGHLYLNVEVSEELKKLDNPYNPQLRDENEVEFRWDHAYYNKHYYMYFGIVPVILVFLPYRLVMGKALTTFRATQLFTLLIIIGLFWLFEFIRRKFFPKMNEWISMLLWTAFSLASVWYFVSAPAMYCTAISSAVGMMIWSFYFYFRAVYDDITFNKGILYAIIGAVLGALSFGCRPSIALGNIVAIPLFCIFIKKYNVTRKELKKIVCIFIPYVIIGTLLMLYNYVRFDNPLEFGQAYQLTIADQQNYSIFSNMGLIKIYNGLHTMFLQSNSMTESFPYISFGGVLAEFPIYIVGLGAVLFCKSVRKILIQNNLMTTVVALGGTVGIVTLADILMSPVIIERYHADVCFILSIFTFLIVGHIYILADRKEIKQLNIVFSVFAIITILGAILLFFVPYDSNYAAYYPEILEKIRSKMEIIDRILIGV